MIKKLTLSAGLLLCILVSSAQSIHFGMKGGLNTSEFASPGNPDFKSTGSNAKIGFQASLFANLDLGRVSIQPAVMYTGKGGRTYMDYIDGDIRDIVHGKASIYYLQIPVNVVYQVPLNQGKLYAGAGPFVSRAVNGQFEAYDKPANAEIAAYYKDRYSTALEFGGTAVNNFKTFDYGINGIIGVQLNKVLLNLNYDLGLANINPQRRSNYKTHTRSAGISIGYMF